MKKFLLLLSLTFLFTQAVLAQKTEIWIVRHGEKDKTNPHDKDPNLSIEGNKRAEDLAVYLKKYKFNVAFSTPYKRTHQILTPLIKRNKIDITDYQTAKELANEIDKQYKGKTIIVAGHSNTILEIIEAFGIERPVAEVNDNDYDYIFHVTLDGAKKRVKTDSYGESNRQKKTNEL